MGDRRRHHFSSSCGRGHVQLLFLLNDMLVGVGDKIERSHMRGKVRFARLPKNRLAFICGGCPCVHLVLFLRSYAVVPASCESANGFRG
jgi:hypothetical protein